jgi:hypothetical protein
MEQLDLFPDMPYIEPVPIETRECIQCEHIHAVKFQDKNLFFCSVRKGGNFGKKIKKSNVVECDLFEKHESELIGQIDGYFGNLLDGVKRNACKG